MDKYFIHVLNTLGKKQNKFEDYNKNQPKSNIIIDNSTESIKLTWNGKEWVKSE